MKYAAVLTAVLALGVSVVDVQAQTKEQQIELLRSKGLLPGVGGEVPEKEVNILRDKYIAVFARYQAVEDRIRAKYRCPPVGSTGTCEQGSPDLDLFTPTHAAYVTTSTFMDIKKTRANYNKAIAAVSAAEDYARKHGF